ncbi:hypothetical protein RF11_14537 [Thelohanellus kitauei]|uniref:Gamma-soluble NSF attachment protein n=1 Tax=Thelohanellus kitauei TaxID=669202 RepID=A0A0C2JVV2_THEKT|nr:hypothetical protein RF11_14537 [Thelohanellus kitauei]
MEKPTNVETEEPEVEEATSYDNRENNYYYIVEKGWDLERSEKFEEAANAYIKAAELAHSSLWDYSNVVPRYEEAAQCFLQIKDIRAITCSLDAVNVYVENGDIERGIEFSMKWGYKCLQELGSSAKPDVLYQKADQLRYKNVLNHSCVITQFDESKYGRNLNKVLDELMKLYAQTALVRMNNCHNITMIYAS